MRITKIVTPKPKEDGLCAVADGTKVYIGDKEVPGITSIDIHLEPGELVTAEVGLFCWPVEIDGVGTRFVMENPLTGKKTEVYGILTPDGLISL